MSNTPVSKDEIVLFKSLVDEFRYDFCKLVYIIFPFGVKGTELEFMKPYEWQMEEWAKLSKHLSDPMTRHRAYRLIVSSGNGAAKTAFGAMTFFMLMYTQRLRGRITANTLPQMTSIVWPEYDIWFRRARYSSHWFEKLGQSIKALEPTLGEVWRMDAVTWDEARPASISGLHNKGAAIMYVFEEAPGIPAKIWDYASGAFTDTETIMVWLAFGNSDDPHSKFEQNMTSPHWHARRIDTRELKHGNQDQIKMWLDECNGNEDHDEFRVRVRGLPRKSSKDSIIGQEAVAEALARSKGFDVNTVRFLPVVLTCDPAWTGGDETTIWYHQGPYSRMLEKYKLDRSKNEDHMVTYLKLVEWERELGADAVLIDQGEGTAIKTLANNAGKAWELISFAGHPNDTLDHKQSPYANIRAQMYYEAHLWLQEGGVLDARLPEWKDEIQKQLCWTNGTRHKVTGKKLCEAKVDVKARVGQSPDIADGFVLRFGRKVLERLEQNDYYQLSSNREIGATPYMMPHHTPDYSGILDAQYDELYNK